MPVIVCQIQRSRMFLRGRMVLSWYAVFQDCALLLNTHLQGVGMKEIYCMLKHYFWFIKIAVVYDAMV